MIKNLNSRIRKNNFSKTLIIATFVFAFFIIFNPLRKLVVYKSTSVFEDKPLGYFVQEYDNTDEFRISNFKPENVNIKDFGYETIRYKKYENVINWTLKADEYFEGYTDVLGICRYHFYVYPNDTVSSSIEIDHQGRACGFWENIKKGDTIQVIGEATTSKRNWTEAGKLEKYATDYVIEVRPMIIKHKNKIYIDVSLPTLFRTQLLKLM